MPSASWISTRARRLMSGKSGIRLASGNELSSVTLTSRIFASQSEGFGGSTNSAGFGWLSSSYHSVAFSFVWMLVSGTPPTWGLSEPA